MSYTTKGLHATMLLVLVTLFSCNSDGDGFDTSFNADIELRELLREASETGSTDYFMLPDESRYAAIPQDPNNPLTKNKIVLGQMLFHETGIGVTNKQQKGIKTYSCASCHQAGASFQAGIAQGIGEGGLGFGMHGEGRRIDADYDPDSIDVQPIRSPSVLNAAYQTNMLWNGQFGATAVNIGTEDKWADNTPIAINKLGYEGVETQAIAGLGVHRLQVNEEVLTELGYMDYFDLVFHDIPKERRYTNEMAGLAIAAYERSIVSNQAPFQKWLRGSGFLSEQEMQGAILFFGRAGCVSCHTGPALNSMTFHALGMHDIDMRSDVLAMGVNDNVIKGRGGFTGNTEDDYKFKTPQLYNLYGVDFLGHGSSFSSVREVIEYKNFADPENPRVPRSHLSDEFVPLDLNAEELDNLEAFILLSLYDSNLERYVPADLPSGSCFPNADYESKEDIGCQ